MYICMYVCVCMCVCPCYSSYRFVLLCVDYIPKSYLVNISFMSHCRENTYWWYLQMVQDLTNLVQ